jgi:hypothetical protein
LGGLSKKAYQIKHIHGLQQLPFLAVDGGNLLFKQKQLSPALLLQAKITAEGITDAYSLMQYDAVAVGMNDLAAGLSFLKEQADRADFKWLSANLVRKSDTEPIFSASLIRRVGDITVGIIGLTAYDGKVHFQDNENAAILPYDMVLPGLVADLAAECDMIVLLSNNLPNQSREISASYPDIHIIVQSTSSSRNSAPQLHNKSLIMQTGNKGKYLGWMLVNWQKSKAWGRQGATRELANKKQELDGINGRIKRIERREPKENLPANTSYQNLLASRARLLSEIIFLENEQLELKETGMVPATYENHFIELDVGLPDHPEVQKIVEATKRRVNQAGRSQATTLPGSAAPSELELEKLAFSGWKICASCHKPQTEFWKKTDHASAYQTLAEQEQQFNLDCLSCHVTAEYKDIKISDNDAVLFSLPSVLQQVGCEVCHGPGRKHAASQDPADISRKPDASICLRCHTPERDEEFNYGNDVERIACPASKR